MKQRFSQLDHNLCWLATEKLLEGKWRRNDVQTFIEEWTGHSRYDLYENELENKGQISGKLRYEIIDELAFAGEEMVDGILHGVDPEFNPVSIRPRQDGSSGKIRNIAYLDMRHQQLGHIVKLGLEGLLKARILPTQHASLPGHGQTGLVRQIRRFLNRKLGIKYFQKTDCTAAYASTMYAAVIRNLEKEIPRGRWIITCMRTLEKYAPGGHLIIGGYLDAWLFNFVMSYCLRYILSLSKSRRGNRYPMVIRCVTYMDDMLMLGGSRSGMQRAVKLAGEWLAARYGIRMRTTTGIIRIAEASEEKERKKASSPARRRMTLIDMGGYRIGRTHVCLRRRNAKKVIRCFRRAGAELKATGTLKRQRACAAVSRNGMAANSDSFGLCAKYNVYAVMRTAKKVQAYWARVYRRKRKELIQYVTEKHRKHVETLGSIA